MILLSEILENSREWSLRPDVVEKDYVLGWLLAGISAQPLTKEWIFKGGTCLKKCYFETYRFSEDLDFTLLESSPFDAQTITQALQEISDWVYEQCGIQIPKDGIALEEFQNPRGRRAMQGRLSYRGPTGPRGSLPRIKLDLTQDEVVVKEPIRRPIAHSYSDVLPPDSQVLSYAPDEVFAEKLRALAERQLPRDLYDIVTMYRSELFRTESKEIKAILDKKCAYKGIVYPTIQQLEENPRHLELMSEWGNMLAHQLPALPLLDQFWVVVPDVLAWVMGTAKPMVPPPVLVLPRETVTEWRAPASITRWGQSAPLELIRFAGANHLCVELAYRKEGAYSAQLYVVEPYSLRRTREGNTLLYARKTDTQQDRTFRVDRIDSVKVTQKSFQPAYQVEFSETGVLQTPLLSKPRLGSSFRSPNSSRRSGYGPTYTIECSYCGKKFRRSTNTRTLNAHKNTDGWPCSGRTGFVVDTI